MIWKINAIFDSGQAIFNGVTWRAKAKLQRIAVAARSNPENETHLLCSQIFFVLVIKLGIITSLAKVLIKIVQNFFVTFAIRNNFLRLFSDIILNHGFQRFVAAKWKQSWNSRLFSTKQFRRDGNIS